MDQLKVALITGANVGLGKEIARQLALSDRYRRVVLACRNAAKARDAQQDLERSTGRQIFEILSMDVSDLSSVRATISSLDNPIDHLVMNAGGPGGKTPFALTQNGVTTIFASNVLGHVALLEGLIEAKKLTTAAVFAGSEAARGVPKLHMKRPSLPTSSVNDFANLCDGTYFRDRKADAALAYGQVKYVGAMWMAALARHHTNLRLITMSPGNTRGTAISRSYPLPLRVMMRAVLMPLLFPLLGLVHHLDQGAKRLVDALDDDTLHTGVFYGSKADKLIGPVIDQSKIFSDLANTAFQDNANEAVHRFL
jgi:NAD(P)-dependent dehydrogenase (short-subunit alcohol dehydrogenase family)